MAQTTTAPAAADRPRRPVSARVSLGRVIRPVPLEYLLVLSAALLLTGIGIVMVVSATTVTSMQAGESPYNDGLTQGIFAAVGIPLMLLVGRMRIVGLQRIAWLALGGALLFQLLVFTPLGYESGGNRNWVRLFGMTVQPSEFLKLALAVWLGAVLYRKRELLGTWKHVVIPAVPVAAVVALSVLAGNDLGTAIVIFLVLLGGLFFSGASLRLFAVPFVLGAVAVVALAVTSENRLNRILSLFDPDDVTCYTTTCYQPLHGIWGLAGGGIFGLGLGNSKEKYDWLPAAADDYIFAIVGEELGLVGCLVVLALFALLAYAALRIVRRSDDLFVRVTAGAITVWIIGQALINIGVVLRVLPTLGVPLPFLSSGGSSLIAVLLGCGVLLACARSLPDPPSRDPAASAAS